MKKNRICQALETIESNGQKAFIPFNLLGYPNPEACLDSLFALIDGGAQVLELGIPFSDPIADGPLIQNASHAVLSAGFTVDEALRLVREVRRKSNTVGINILTYYNIALARDPDRFLQDLKTAGVDGVTFVDLPIEEIDEIYEKILNNDLAPVMLISPLTPKQRIERIVEYARGFIYLVSRAGITGMDDSRHTNLKETLTLIKSLSPIPVLIGFGISNPDQAKEMIKAGADGVIVGSKILSLIDENEVDTRASVLSRYTKEMIEAISLETTYKS